MSDNETNQMWRESKGRQRAHRDTMERIMEGKLAKLVVAGLCDAVPLGDYGWRITAKDRQADWWPRTGKWRTPRGEVSGGGWRGMLKHLGIHTEAKQRRRHEIEARRSSPTRDPQQEKKR